MELSENGKKKLTEKFKHKSIEQSIQNSSKKIKLDETQQEGSLVDL